MTNADAPATPMLDKARSDELTSSEIEIALRELEALDPNAGAPVAEIGIGRCAIRWGRFRFFRDEARAIEDALEAARVDILKASAS